MASLLRFSRFLFLLVIIVGLYNVDSLIHHLSSSRKPLQYTTSQLAKLVAELTHQAVQINYSTQTEAQVAQAMAMLAMLKEKVEKVELENQLMRMHLSKELQFFPLKDLRPHNQSEDHVFYYFMSSFKGRGYVEGPPELFTFPSNLSNGHLLCLKGNYTVLGEKNSYGFAPKGHLPFGSSLIPGLTFISDTFWDFINPWHAMYNLLQFVYWRLENQCASGDNLLLFHRSEYRFQLGRWIENFLRVNNLPSRVLVPGQGSGRPRGHENIMCFEKAVVSRRGLGGMTREMRRRTLEEARCQARRICNVQIGNHDSPSMNITLLVRNGSRAFLHEEAWRQVVKEQCEATPNCNWSAINLGSLTFCQQVEAMSYTSIVLSVHGAHLSNMIFMSAGGRIMELFPKGWLEYAGDGQYVMKGLANWVGLQHEGYWRDLTPAPCPDPNNRAMCFLLYKHLQLTKINTTEISSWLRQVITNYRHSTTLSTNNSSHKGQPLPHLSKCECPKILNG